MWSWLISLLNAEMNVKKLEGFPALFQELWLQFSCNDLHSIWYLGKADLQGNLRSIISFLLKTRISIEPLLFVF